MPSSGINNIIKYFQSRDNKSYFSRVSYLKHQRASLDYENCFKILKYAHKLDSVNVCILL